MVLSNNFVDEKLIPNVSHALQRCTQQAIAALQRLSFSELAFTPTMFSEAMACISSFCLARPHWAQTVRKALI
ncbi:hypothetical protein Peur_029648 [Populus x canadensis]